MNVQETSVPDWKRLARTSWLEEPLLAMPTGRRRTNAHCFATGKARGIVIDVRVHGSATDIFKGRTTRFGNYLERQTKKFIEHPLAKRFKKL